MAKVGDTIRILSMNREPQYSGKEGVITNISTDPWGDQRFDGTWGGCAVYPGQDSYEVIKKG